MMVAERQIKPCTQNIIFRREFGDTINIDFHRFNRQRIDGICRELNWTVDYGERRQANWQLPG